MKKGISVSLILALGMVSMSSYSYADTNYRFSASELQHINTDTQVYNNERYVQIIQQMSTDELQRIIDQTNKYKNSHPELDVKEVNRYLKNLLDNSVKKGEVNLYKPLMKKLPSDYLPTNERELGPTEKAVFNSNFFYGAQCLLSGKIAWDTTIQKWSGANDYHNDNADAYRHTYWNALMAFYTNSDYAKKFADAHEKDFPNDGLESSMDFYNNQKGREIGSKWYPGSSAGARAMGVERAVLNAIKQGELKRFVGTDIGTLNRLVSTNAKGLK